jgi:hypothetical protein
MKTSLAIVLAVAALTIGTATVAPISSTALAGGGGPDKWCGAAVCPTEAGTLRDPSRAVSIDVGRPLHGGRPLVLRLGTKPQNREIRNVATNDR